MLISLNWLKKYVDIKIPNEELISLIGSRLVEVEGVIDQTHKYDNIYAVCVEACEKIPDTKLTLCQIDAGQKEPIQVVCGAPNVRAGMLAVWIAPGATVPASVHEDAPFVIGARKMRGYVSNGMLAGADELDFGDDHSGIVELEPGSAKPGSKLADLFELNDLILDIENKSLTHRPDTFGLIGFAREIAGILGQSFKTPEFLFNDASSDFILSTQKDQPELKIRIEDSKLCPRYTALILSRRGDKKDKYLDLQDTLLARSGMRPIDPIVDLTNYLMLLTGQPLHAFDYDKLLAVAGQGDATKTQAEIIIRAGKPSDQLELINGHKIDITSNDIVITANHQPIALAGAMGGKNTEIDQETRRVILESATFSLYNLRKTQMTHGIFSEAITRFTKGQPAFQTLAIAKEFALLGRKYLKAVQLIDAYPAKSQKNIVKITTEEINQLLGSNYSLNHIKHTLEHVEFEVEVDAQTLDITAPAWRTDIHIKEDIIEEIGRLSGYDNIPPTLPLHASASKDPLLTFKKSIRDTLASFGANELLTYSFVHGDLITKFGQDPENSYKITNSISPDLQYIRQQIAPSLFTKAYENIKDGYNRFALFEMNQVFLKNDGLNTEKVPVLHNNLALIVANKAQEPGYYLAKKYLESLLIKLGFRAHFEELKNPAKHNAFYEPKRSALILINDTPIGIIGELKNSIAHAAKLPQGVAAFELSIDQLLKTPSNLNRTFKISQFPSVNRDLSLIVPENRKFIDIQNKIEQILSKTELIFSVTPLSIFQKNNPTSQSQKNTSQLEKTFSFRLEFAHPDKTLGSPEINAIMKQLESIK